MRRFFILLMLFAVTLPAFLGCREADEVGKTDVTYDDRQPMRQRIAIFKQDSATFYVKVLGPTELVKQHEEAFEKFARSAKIDPKQEPATITFDEPKNWKKDPAGAGDRLMGFRIDAKPKELEVTVVRLKGDHFSLIDNIRRWQKFVHVPISETAEDAQQFTKREKIGEQEVLWVAMDGLGVHTVSKPPDPALAHSKKFQPLVLGKGNKGGAAAPRGVPFKFTVPDGWKTGASNDIVLARWLLGDGANATQVTLTRVGGDVKSNLNRWHDELKLPHVSAEEAERAAARRMIAGSNSYYWDLQNPNGPAGKTRIVVVMIPEPNEFSWFVKMTGPIDFVGKHKKEFEAFIDSFKK